MSRGEPRNQVEEETHESLEEPKGHSYNIITDMTGGGVSQEAKDTADTGVPAVF